MIFAECMCVKLRGCEVSHVLMLRCVGYVRWKIEFERYVSFKNSSFIFYVFFSSSGINIHSSPLVYYLAAVCSDKWRHSDIASLNSYTDSLPEEKSAFFFQGKKEEKSFLDNQTRFIGCGV